MSPLELQVQPVADLGSHVRIRSTFETPVVYDAARVMQDGMLVERSLPVPFRKDYDAAEDPSEWHRFDMSRWAVVAAFLGGRRVGGVIVAIDTPGVDMLEGRSDLVVLWDVRVDPHARRNGVGTALFRAAENWARDRGCRELKVETQNVNVGACRLYRRCGCSLAEVNPGVYPAFPDEVQLIWRKRIDG